MFSSWNGVVVHNEQRTLVRLMSNNKNAFLEHVKHLSKVFSNKR